MTGTSHADVTPLRLPARVRSLVVFGGTFDPPHRWHLRIARAALRELFARELSRGAARVVLIPAAKSPLKSTGPVASDADRLAMLRLAVRSAGSPAAFTIWTDELDRAAENAEGKGGPSYTIDTLRRLVRAVRRDSPSVDISTLRLLIGADQAVNFHRWRSHRSIMRLAKPAVALRAPYETPDLLIDALRTSGAWSPRELKAWRSRILETPVRDISSTSVRSRKTARELDKAVAAPVARYIRAHRLYR